MLLIQLLATLHFISQAQQAGQPVVITSWMEILTAVSLLALVSAFATAYHHIECHQDGCHRLGRFTHGHFKLCHVHHPLVPSDGRVTAEHIAAVGRSLGPLTPHTELPVEETT
jgi:hypothetical protein